ncbi:sulfatase [Lacihabitans sp. LS3-19]|uniref:sulfatase n=1 Tax=Lacihabitans sp. LS3-19 TaxID=2487335 RepID=UPI0020CF1B0B|nr:sulfatase [Lacihabitans sp. LS3-19]MCP9766594.1 sulfatase [Lacihabitans sp. LS3-19]
MKKILALFCLFSQIIFAQNKPNIIVFIVDDMGWQDCSLPFYKEKTTWNERYKTPNMERLAAQGKMFTHAYAASVCSPSRVSLMTGMNAINHHVTNWTLRKNANNDGKSEILTPPQININGLSAEPNIENTIYASPLPMVLKQNGYHTIHVGKAHLGANDTPGSDPLNLGFEVNIAGHAAGAPHSYFGKDDFGNKDKKNLIWAVPGLEKYWGKEIFLTEALTQEAIAELDKSQNSEKPFFLYMSHYAVHAPIMGDPRFLQKYYDMGIDSAEAKYAALIEGMDKSLGDIMDFLEKTKQDKNTAILFLSDNGGLSANARGGEKHMHNTPLKSGKGSAYEGGVRIPFIMKWPGKIKEKTKSTENIIIEDIFPTVLQIANIKPQNIIQKIDGKSILDKKLNNSKRFFFWHYPHIWGPKGPALKLYSVIRQGDWKLIYFHEDGSFELYNTETDISETKNLVFENEKLAKKLSKKLTSELKKGNSGMPTLIKTGQKIPYPDQALVSFLGN